MGAVEDEDKKCIEVLLKTGEIPDFFSRVSPKCFTCRGDIPEEAYIAQAPSGYRVFCSKRCRANYAAGADLT